MTDPDNNSRSNEPAGAVAAPPTATSLWRHFQTGLLWLAVLGALAMAFNLLWGTDPASGETFDVTFLSGHNLREGSPVKFRDTEVGTVLSVSPMESRDRIMVKARLHPETKNLNLTAEGSRFWIARAGFDLTNPQPVVNIETVIGNSFLAILPGDGPPSHSFVGEERDLTLENTIPPDALRLQLFAANQGNLRPGSKVTFRGHVIGVVLRCELSGDSREIHVDIAINPPHHKLVGKSSRFYNAASLEGIFQADVSVWRMIVGAEEGVKVNASPPSVENLIFGEIAMVTPEDPDAQAEPGDRFELFPGPQAEWAAWSPLIEIGTPTPTGLQILPATLSWIEKRRIFWEEPHSVHSNALATPAGWLLPAEMTAPPERAQEGSLALAIGGGAANLATVGPAGEGELLVLLGDPALPDFPSALSAIPLHSTPVALRLIRSDGKATLFGPERFIHSEGRWLFVGESRLDRSWHGAPATTAADGSLVGIVLTDGDQHLVVPLPSEVLPPANAAP